MLKSATYIDSHISVQDPFFDSLVSACRKPGISFTPAESISIDTFIDKCGEDIVQLSQKIKEIREHIFHSCFKMAKHYSRILERKNQIKIAQSLSAPVRSVPQEILEVIFKMCVASDRSDIMDSRRAPLLLCQICHAWREIAMSNPSLWTSPTFALGPRRLKSVSNYVNFTQFVMERIQTKPLDLRITGLEAEPQSTPLGRIDYLKAFSPAQPRTLAQRIQFLQAFLPLFSRSKVLRLVVNKDWYAALQQFQLKELVFQNLESVSLFITNSERKPFGSLSLFNIAPILSRFSLTLNNPSDLKNCIVRPSQLSEFSFRLARKSSHSIAAALPTLHAFLSDCTNLQFIAINWIVGDTWQTIPDIERSETPLILESVEKLSVTANLVGNMDVLLQDFIFPNLTHFHFEVPHYACEVLYSGSPLTTCSGYVTMPVLSQISSSLTHLTLLRVSIADYNLLPIFRSFPSLTYLKILNLQFIDPEWHGITSIESASQLVQFLIDTTAHYPENPHLLLLPRLSHLHLYHPKRPSDFDALVAMYAKVVKIRSEMNRAKMDNVMSSSGSFFSLGLSFCEEYCTLSDISRILTTIGAQKPLSDVYYEILDTFDGTNTHKVYS